MYRGYNNRSCEHLAIQPGTSNDKYKYEPIWFGPPEVTIIYCIRNMYNYMLQRIMNGEINPSISNLVGQEILGEIILKYNLASNLAYSVIKPCELIDMNNIHNINKIIELFEQNFTINNFLRLKLLNRITPKQLDLLNKLIAYIPKDEIINKFGKANKKDIYFNKLYTVLLWNFKYVFGFGEYFEFDQKNMIYIKPTRNNTKHVGKIIKYYNKIYTDKLVNDNKSIETIRTENLEILKKLDDDEVSEEINDEQQIYTKIESNLYTSIKKKIKTNLEDENKLINKRYQDFRLFKLNERKYAKNIIQEIKNNPTLGYYYDFDNGSIGMLKLDENKYQVYIYRKDYNKRKYYNPAKDSNIEQINCK